ncbi:MAG: hypothetical protein ABIS67_15150, partial [Candidatus Eisenbacteria bacterium]
MATGRGYPAARSTAGAPTRYAAALSLLLAAMIVGPPARAQVFRVGAGASSLDRVAGGSIELHAQGYAGWFGIGALNPIRF